jgi:peptidyl-prolyl cis-trans isomerase SurA
MESSVVNVLLRSISLLLLFVMTAPISAQEEGEPTVVDEVIAQVNGDVITLSQLKREMKEYGENLKQQGVPEKQAQEQVAKRQAELIFTLINEQLLLQKGKELNLEDEVEAEVNRRLMEIAKEQNIKTIEALDEAMRAGNIDPAVIKQTWRKEIMKGLVISREVDAKIFFSLTGDEVKKYFQANQQKFRRPESVVLSEIFLSIAGKPEEEVRQKATQIAAQARAAGADFGALATTHSERMQNGNRVAEKSKGRLGRFKLEDLRPDLASTIKTLKAGQVSDPIRTDEGFQIVRVDEKTTASDAITFNENQVREAMTSERAEKERHGYLQKLRDEAYIKIATTYRASVEPFMNKKAVSATTK